MTQQPTINGNGTGGRRLAKRASGGSTGTKGYDDENGWQTTTQQPTINWNGRRDQRQSQRWCDGATSKEDDDNGDGATGYDDDDDGDGRCQQWQRQWGQQRQLNNQPQGGQSQSQWWWQRHLHIDGNDTCASEMATTQPVVRQRRVVERRRLCEEDAPQPQQPAGANEEGGGSRMDTWGGWCIIFVVETPSLGQAKISNNLQWSWGKSQLLMKWLNEWVTHVTKIASRQIIGSFWHGQCFSKLRNEKETFFLVQWSRIE